MNHTSVKLRLLCQHNNCTLRCMPRTLQYCIQYSYMKHLQCVSLIASSAGACTIHRVSIKKTTPLIFGHNFCDRRPVFKILSLIYSQRNFQCACDRDFHLTSSMLLHYLVKSENSKHKQNYNLQQKNYGNLFYMEFIKT